MISLFLFSSSAHAFCGTFVGAPGSQLANRTSQVVLAREGSTNTLTLVADYEGELDEFAMVLPVPSSLDVSAVTAIDPAVIDRLDRYSTPRLVSYTCQDAVTYTHSGGGSSPGCAMVLGGCSSALDDPLGEGLPADVVGGEAEGAVTVQAEFTVAEYDVVLLAAEGAGGLTSWLADNGYALPEGGDAILQDYIDGGASFLAAKVRLDVIEAGPTRLSPLQLSYEAPELALPIRIGTISAVGRQDVVLYTLTDAAQGQAQILNYPERDVEDECMWPGDSHPSFGAYYSELLEAEQGAGWVTEYSWTLYQEVPSVKCDPCTVEIEELYDRGELVELGFDGPAAHLTRLRMSYGPDEVPEDLSIGTTGSPDSEQIRFVEYDRQLEFLFPVCGEGYRPDPGQCGDDGSNAIGLSDRSAVPWGLLAGLGLGLLTGLRRRS